MSTYAKFKVELGKEFDKKIVGVIDSAMEEAGIKGHSVAVMGTPVDTGKLASEWRLTKTEKSKSNPQDQRKPRGHKRGTNLFMAEQQGASSSAAKVAKTFDSRKHKALFLTNNMVYASTINDQFGMMEKALAAMDNILGRRLR